MTAEEAYKSKKDRAAGVKRVELPLNEYLSYENGINMNASKAKYQRVLNKLNATIE